MKPDDKRSACCFWILTLSTFVSTTIYTSFCIIHVGSCDTNVCLVLEGLTVLLVIGFLCVMFWYCYKLKIKNSHSSSYFADPLPVSTETVDSLPYGCGDPLLTAEEYMDNNLLKPVPPDKLPPDFECPICNEGCHDNTKVTELSCKHMFHKSCVSLWFTTNKHRTCPICRSCQIPSNRLLVITIVPVLNEHSRPFRVSQL